MSVPGAIEPLGPADTAAAVALWTATGLTRPWNDAAADCARAIGGPASTVLGMRDGDALIGSVMVGDDGHRGWLYYLAVDEARRGRGLGRALVRAAEAWLMERGCPKAQLMIRQDNAAARGFYAAIGYAQSDVVVVARRLGSDPASSSRT